MQMVKKIFIAIVLVWFVLILFMPKQEIYYKLEESLDQNDIRLNEESIDEGWFSLTLHKVDVYVKGIQLATIDEVNVFTLLFYTKVEIENLFLDESLKSKMPTKIEALYANHSIMMPWSVHLEVFGPATGATGSINLKENTLHLDLNNTSTKDIEMLQSVLQKNEKGWYYETSF